MSGAESLGADAPSEDAVERPIRAMLVEDHHLVRAAIGDTLRGAGFEVTAEAATAEEALMRMADARPDVILVDIELPGMNGIALVRELVARVPDVLIIVLTGSPDDDHLLTAMRAGASGYLTKDLSPQALVRAVRGALQGDLPMPRRMAARVIRELVGSERRRKPQPSAREGLMSVREEEVLALVSGGLTDRAIGERLGISPRTVEHHVGSILGKLGVSSRAAAARAWKVGLRDAPGRGAASRPEDALLELTPTDSADQET
ncbi:response regulator transcription factor [soil metagenome]